MPISTAPALLIGLGARIALDIVNRRDANTPQTLPQIVLLGVWQGVALQYSGWNSLTSLIIILAIIAKLAVDFTTAPDTLRTMYTVFGVIMGAMGTEVLAASIDPYLAPYNTRGERPYSSRRRTRGTSDRRERRTSRPTAPRDPRLLEPGPTRSERLVQFHASVQGGSVTTDPNDRRAQSTALTSDITSVDSATGLLSSRRASTMSPLERDIAALRARASLADSERRRCREERKWALSQGNTALASELKANYKRFKALMEDCHKEADAKLLEDAREKAARNAHGTPRTVLIQDGQDPSTPQSRRHRRSSQTRRSSSRTPAR